MMGCIPVIPQDHLFQYHEDVVPYHEFSVRITMQDIDIVDDILRAISEREVKALQRGLQKWHKHFLWNPNRGGLAFETTIESKLIAVLN